MTRPRGIAIPRVHAHSLPPPRPVSVRGGDVCALPGGRRDVRIITLVGAAKDDPVGIPAGRGGGAEERGRRGDELLCASV